MGRLQTSHHRRTMLDRRSFNVLSGSNHRRPNSYWSRFSSNQRYPRRLPCCGKSGSSYQKTKSTEREIIMNHLLATIHWNPNPELFNLLGISIRYYGLLWAVGILFAYLVVHYQYRDKKIGEDKFEPLFFYCFFGIVLGARLGHCLFYQPEYYLNHLTEMILPIKILPDGSWKFSGYEGLASHGGTLGLMIALWLYVRKTKVGIWTVLDNVAIATPIAAFFIRMGNLMNSEIIGKETDVTWALIFERVDMMQSHPGQLYEA